MQAEINTSIQGEIIKYRRRNSDFTEIKKKFLELIRSSPAQKR
jgi:hypothetical protein